MKLKALGRHLLVEMQVENVESTTAGGIVLPKEHVDKERAGVQIARVLSVGETAFDDEPSVCIMQGDLVVTERYPGTKLDLDPAWDDEKTHRFRVIGDKEVRAIVAEDGVEL